MQNLINLLTKEKPKKCYHINTDTEYLGSKEAKKEAVEKGWTFYKEENPKQETLEKAMKQNGYHESDYDKIWREGVEFGVKWQQERMISKEAYEDCLNMQKCSNAGYESKILELQEQIKKMYSEKQVKHIISEALQSALVKVDLEQ